MAVVQAPSTPFIKCPPYCRVNCIIKHHPLLVALLNALDSDDMVISKGRLQDLEHVVKKYIEANWKLTDNIPESVENFRYSLLHWACSMGRISATYWLLSKGVPSNLKSVDSEEETPLHRALLCLQETCPRIAAERYHSLLLPLEECLLEKNAHGTTPLVLCAEMIVNEMPRAEYYLECFNSMLDYTLEAKSRVDAKKMVNLKNSDGDSVLHILVTNNKQLPCIQRVVSCGADLISFNKKGKTPMDIAVQSGHMRIAKFLENFMMDKIGTLPKGTDSSTVIADIKQSWEAVNGPADLVNENLKRILPKKDEADEPVHKQTRLDEISGELRVVIPTSGCELQGANEQSPALSQTALSQTSGLPSQGSTSGSVSDSTASRTPNASPGKESQKDKDKPDGSKSSMPRRLGMTNEEKEDSAKAANGSLSYKKLQLNTTRLLDRGRGPIRGVSTLNTPGADRKIVKFLQGCSNVTRKIFRNSIEADREILEDRSNYLQSLADGVQMEIMLNSERQKQKVEGIQRLLDLLKTLQKEEKGYDQLIKQMLVQMTQTTQAIDGLKERLTHCTSALGVLSTLDKGNSPDTNQEAEGSNSTQKEAQSIQESGVGNETQLVSIDLKDVSEPEGKFTDTKVEVTTSQPGTTGVLPEGDPSLLTDLVIVEDSTTVADITINPDGDAIILHGSKEELTFEELQQNQLPLSQEFVDSSQMESSQEQSEASQEASECSQ